MKDFKAMVDHYRNNSRMDNDTAWSLIEKFMDKIKNSDGKGKHGDEDGFMEMIREIHEKVKGKHFDEMHGEMQVEKMQHMDEKGNKIRHHLFTFEDAKKVYDRKVRSMGRDISPWDVYVALNAQYHDNACLYKKWFPNINEEEMKEKVVEATICNWFSEDDSKEDKVWNYFKSV